MANFKLKKGIDIPLTGSPVMDVKTIDKVSILKIHPVDIKGIKPKVLVKEGESVKTGSTLFYDKVLDGVNFVSPGTGTVQSIKLGDR